MEKNSTILDSVWLTGTNDYQQRVPNSTQGDISQTVRTLFDPMNGFLYNQFIDSLIMRIANTRIHSDSWKNPLGNLKGNMLEYGNTMQEFVPKWIKAHSYAETRHSSNVADFFADDLLNVYKPEGQAWYHSVNRQDKYPISINDEELRRAFTTEYGLNELVNSILQVPINSDNYDEYRIMLQLTAEYMDKWGGYVDVLDNDPTTEAGGKELLRKVRSYTGQLQFPSARYNAKNVDVPVFVKPDNLVLLVTPDMEAYIDVNVLSATFHVELADVNVRRVIVDEFPIPNVVAMLVSEDWFVVHDKVYRTTNFYNPAELINTYWLHHWEICSVSPFMPCIYFMYGAGSATVTPTVTQEVTGMTFTDLSGASAVNWSLADGDTVELRSALQGTIDGDSNDTFSVLPDSVVFDLTTTGDNSDGRTYVSTSDTVSPVNYQAYTLHLGKAKAGDVITVKATATYINPSGTTNTYTQTVTVTVAA